MNVAVAQFFDGAARAGAGVLTVMQALCEEDGRRPPDYFEKKLKERSEVGLCVCLCLCVCSPLRNSAVVRGHICSLCFTALLAVAVGFF